MLRGRVKCRPGWVGGVLSPAPPPSKYPKQGQSVGGLYILWKSAVAKVVGAPTSALWWSDRSCLLRWPVTTLSCRRATRPTGAAAQLRVAASRFAFCLIHRSRFLFRVCRPVISILQKPPLSNLPTKISYSFVCLFSWVAVCQNVAFFFFLCIFFFFLKSIASGLMGFAFVSLAVRPPGRHDNLCTFFPAVLLFFLSAGV